MASKATTIKDALKRWEDRTKHNCIDAKHIDLQFQWPPIEKMDNTLSTLIKCEYVIIYVSKFIAYSINNHIINIDDSVYRRT